MAIIKDETAYIINGNKYKQILELLKNQDLIINNLLREAKINKAEVDLLNTQIDASVKFVNILKYEL
jgi:hypothetical protein